MKISDLKLINYRNFDNFEIKLSTKGAIIFGVNGIGKTNLLESISYLAWGKSIFGLKDTELIKFDSEFFRIESNVEIDDKNHKIEIATDSSQKIVKFDNIVLKNLSELYDHLKVIFFSPADINLISGFPAGRRKFIDIAISQTDKQYIVELKKFKKILKQRNALLKSDFDKLEKEIWDDEFIAVCTKIHNKRNEYIEFLEPVLQKIYFEISNHQENVGITYKHSFHIEDPQNYKNILKKQIDDNFLNEKKYERTLFGTHLDDLSFILNGNSLQKYGSQGQKRAFVIALRLAQAELIEEKAQTKPIMIFDDVLAEIDVIRSKKIIELLNDDYQVFIATPHIEAYSHLNLAEINLEKLLATQ